jgi:hypothetical protein
LYKQGVPKWNYSTPATKRKDGKMGLHEIKKLLHNKKKIVSKLKRPPTKLEKNLRWLYIRQRTNNKDIQGAPKIKLPQNQ